MPHPQFQVKTARNSWFYFNLTAPNGKIVFSSEMFKTKDDCLSGIERVRKNAHLSGHYIAKLGKYGQIYFVLRTANDELLGKSGFYSSVPELEKGIELVKKNVSVAEVNYLIPVENNLKN
jgi:uncharacterized protein